MSRFLVIVGQTGSGKSELAMRVAQDNEGEIISADSRAVYKGLDIGTAKPSALDQQLIKHHLIDVADWSQPYTVAHFQQAAIRAIDDIYNKKKLPILVGGSGLYVDSVLYNYQFNDAVADQTMRAELNKLSVEELQRRVLIAGLQLPENQRNKRYLVRALERGESQDDRKHIRSDALVVGLAYPRDAIQSRLEKRLDALLEQGLLDELKQALKAYPPDSEALKGDLYRAFKPYLKGEATLLECRQDALRRELRLAKRQITWFKRNKSIVWFDSTQKAYEHIIASL